MRKTSLGLGQGPGQVRVWLGQSRVRARADIDECTGAHARTCLYKCTHFPPPVL